MKATGFTPRAAAISPPMLPIDLWACMNASELARRQFRGIARVAGLIIQGMPGTRKPLRHLQASSEMFYDVFTQHDPQNLLLAQARREVLEGQLEWKRLHATLLHLTVHAACGKTWNVFRHSPFRYGRKAFAGIFLRRNGLSECERCR